MVVLIGGLTTPLAACPFCTALAPSLAQWREQAVVVALVEVDVRSAERQTDVIVHRVIKGSARLGTAAKLQLSLDVDAKPGSLLLIFGTAGNEGDELSWHAVAVNEASYAYFMRIPSLKTANSERLRYFARYLEHDEPLVAEDAYLEFGHAPFDEVARVADALPMSRMRAWVGEARVPQTHKGLYGLALGLPADAETRGANQQSLERLIMAPADDFRAGFDGVLGGYLLLAGDKGLALVESRYLANPKAADGDVRHAQTALRFYWEYGHDIPPTRLCQAMRRLLAREEFAASAATDLARWKDWTAIDQVAALYNRAGSNSAATRRAVVGYLTSCPQVGARAALTELRRLDPQGVAAAEHVLSRTTDAPPVSQ
ncbi:MAG TPA: hypothetical protein VHV08_11175 [Pirellulales bacterium]|nr:hypothetical protein [Pirellulales bacterium]